jgi:hypothetical protein
LPGRSGVGGHLPDGKGLGPLSPTCPANPDGKRLGPLSPTCPAAPNPTGQSPRAAVSVSNARAEASRKNGANSRGPNTLEGKTRSAQNALKQGLRAQKYVVLPEEDAAGLEAALVAELAPKGALQVVLARRVAVAAWRLARADRIETELFEERRYADGGLGLALIRDGNGTRSFETLLRYRGAAMAEFWRALKTLKALQAEQAATELHVAAPAPVCAQPRGRTARSQMAHRPEPSEPERGRECPTERRVEYVLPDRPAPGRTLHEPAAPRMAKEPNRRLPSCRRRHGPVSHRRNPTGAAMLANPANRRSRSSAAQLTGATILSGCRSCPAPPWIPVR